MADPRSDWFVIERSGDPAVGHNDWPSDVREPSPVADLESLIGRLDPDEYRRRKQFEQIVEWLLTHAVLRSQWARRAEHRLAMGDAYQDNGLVFAQPDGTPLDPESVSKAFRPSGCPEQAATHQVP